MELEVISKSPTAPGALPPILLLHGAWHGAWSWQGNFLDYFADNGWETHALSLRGHGQSEGKENIRRWTIADYVSDVHQVVNSLRSEPVLVGHSMGGFVIQKYLEQHSAKAAVLLAPVPPSGTLTFNLRVLRRHPLIWFLVNLLKRTYPVVKKPAHAREWLFSENIPEEKLAAHHAKLQEESYRASLDMLLFNLPKPHLVNTPVAVLGAENDNIFSVKDVEKTARAYGVKAKIFQKMAHNMMSETNWQDVAEWILRWCESVDIMKTLKQATNSSIQVQPLESGEVTPPVIG